MKRILTILLLSVATLLSYGQDFTYTYEGQTITYTVIDEDAGTCQTKEGEENSDSSWNRVSGSLILPAHPKDGDKEYTLTKIGNNSFYACNDLTSITIPESVTTIGAYAFYCCWSLTSVTIPDSVTDIERSAFNYCYGLQEVNTGSIDNWLKIKFENEYSNPTYYAKKFIVGGETIRRLNIPDGIERINAYAFYHCDSFVTVSLPASFRSVGDYAFAGCTGLQRFVFPTVEDYLSVNYDSPDSRLTQGNNSKIYIGSNPLDKPLDFTNLVIPSWMTRIPDYAFYGNNDILTVSMHNSIVEIGKGAFENCNNLTSVEFPKSNFEIKESAFQESGLKSADFSGRNVKIGKNSFYDCSSLATVNFSSGTSEIGERAFAETGLTAVELPESISIIQPGTFRNCHNLGNVIIPASVNSIKNDAFAGCKAIQRLTLKGNVKFFGENAFGYTGVGYSEICTSIQELDISDYNAWCKAEFESSVTNYYYYYPYSNPIQAAKKLLCNGSKITTLDINIPDEDISDYAFYKAPSLTAVNITARNIGDYAFYNCKTLKKVTFNKVPKSIGSDAFGRVNADVTEIPSANEWALVNFIGSEANPISRSEKFTVKGTVPKHLVLDIDGYSVSSYAFYGAKQLESAKVTAESIGENAFADCNLQNLFVDVNSIGENAFSPNENMKRIYSVTATPPAANDNVFSKYDGIQLYVPDGAVSDYENAENCWWRFLDVFESDFSDLSSIFGRDYDDGPVDAVNDVTSDAKEYRVVTSGGCVSLIGADDEAVSICTMSGIPVYTGRGCTEVPLAPGMYILRAGSFSTKFAVR